MARDLAVIAFDGVHFASVGVFLDLFALMRQRVSDKFKMRDDVGMDTHTRMLGHRLRPVLASNGRRLEPDDGFDDGRQHLMVHVPDFDCPDDHMAEKLGELRGAVDWLARQHANGAHLSATGRGIFLLAEANLLDQEPVPLARSDIHAFHLRYPRIRIDPTSPIVERSTISMARGMAHEMSMIMRLIARLMSSTMAGSLAEAMGGQENEQEGLSDDPLVAAAQVWLGANLSRKCRIAALADHLAVSQQTLIRRFRAELGMTPRDYLRLQRVTSAQPQLSETTRPIAQIATLVGYDDLKSFRHAFRTCTGMSAARYRMTHSR